MRRSRISAASVALAAGLSGCAGSTTTYNEYFGNWDPATVDYMAAQGGVLTEVKGNPFDAPKPEVEKAITDAMYGAHFGSLVPFVTEVPQNHTSPYRVIMLFNPERTVNASKMCRQEASPGAGSPGEVKLLAVLCAREYRETSVIGRASDVSGPQDPKFRQLVRAMTSRLLPRENQQNREDAGGGSDWTD